VRSLAPRSPPVKLTLALCSDLPCGETEFEYVVVEALEPTLFVLHKRCRADPPRRLSVFFCLHGSVYAAPTLHAVLQARLARCSFDAREALDALRERLAAPEAAFASGEAEKERKVERFCGLALAAWDRGELAQVGV